MAHRKWYYNGKWHDRPADRWAGHTWPMVSHSAAIHPDQIGEFRAAAQRDGVPTDYTETGEPILTSKAHRKRYLKHRGFIDKRGFD